MGNKKLVLNLFVILIIVIVISSLSTIQSVSYDDRYDNAIINRTNRKYLDTITYAGLRLLNIKGITIFMSNVPKVYTTPNGEEGKVRGFIREYTDNIYGIFVSDENINESIEVLSHELIHLIQYHSNELVNKRKYYIWQKDTLYHPIKYSYKDKPWEIEAREVGDLLEQGIKLLLME